MFGRGDFCGESEEIISFDDEDDDVDDDVVDDASSLKSLTARQMKRSKEDDEDDEDGGGRIVFLVGTTNLVRIAGLSTKASALGGIEINKVEMT